MSKPSHPAPIRAQRNVGRQRSVELGRGRIRGRLPGASEDKELDLDLNIRIIDRPAAVIIERELVQVGNLGAGRYIELSELGVHLYANATLLIALLAKAQAINGESLSAGDILMGSNASGKANLLWDESAGQLKFRGATVTELYIDTDGSLVAGAGDVTLNSGGLQFKQGSASTQKIRFLDGSVTIGHIYTATSAGTGSTLQLLAQGKNSTNPEGAVEIVAWTYDNQPHAGSAAVTLELSTEDDLLQLNAGTVRVAGTLRLSATDAALILNKLTSTQRDNLSPVSGMIIFNTTTNTFQGYDGTAWRDFH